MCTNILSSSISIHRVSCLYAGLLKTQDSFRPKYFLMTNQIRGNKEMVHLWNAGVCNVSFPGFFESKIHNNFLTFCYTLEMKLCCIQTGYYFHPTKRYRFSTKCKAFNANTLVGNYVKLTKRKLNQCICRFNPLSVLILSIEGSMNV